MKRALQLYYDEEGDFLELHLGRHTPGHFKNLGEGIFECVDDKTKQVVGIAIHGFRKRTAARKDISITLPFDVNVPSEGERAEN